MNKNFIFFLIAFYAQDKINALENKYKFGNKQAPTYLDKQTETTTAKKKIDLKQYNNLEMNKDIQDLKKTLDGIQLLLQSDIPEVKKNELYFKQSLVQYTIGKMLNLKRSNNSNPTTDEIEYFQQSENYLKALLNKTNTTSDLQARCYYLMGLLDFEKNNFSGQKDKFLKSFQIDPNTTYSATISLNIAEQYFDEENYPQAIKYYRMKFNEMTLQQKTIAKYKLAWSYVGLKNNKAAVELFKSIINDNFDKNFIKDSIRDLALLATLDWTELEVIQYAKTQFKSIEVQKDFLYIAFKFFFNKNKNDFKNLLFEECLQYNHSIENRLLLHSYATSAARKGYGSIEFTKSINRLQKDMVKFKIPPQSKNFIDFSKDLEINNEYFIRILVETLTKKIKNIENISESEIRNQIYFHIKIHNYYFSKSEIIPTLLEILIDIAIDEKNYLWLDEVIKSLNSISNEKTKINLELRSRKEQIVLLQNAVLQKPELSATLETAYENFISKFPGDEVSILIYKKRAQEAFKGNDFRKSISYFQQTLKFENSEENVYKLLFAYFQNNEFQQVINFNLEPNYKSERISNIYKETFLALAKSAKANKNLIEFEKNILSFKKLSTDIKKNQLATNDLITFASENLTKEQFLTFLLKQETETLKSPDVTLHRLNLIDQFLNSGQINQTKQLLNPLSNEKLIYLDIIINESEKNILPQLKNLSPELKKLVVSHFTMTQPELALKILRQQINLNDDDKQFYLLALKLNQGTDEPTLSDLDLKFYGKQLSKLDESVTPLELKLKKLDFPDAKLKASKYGTKLENVINNIKKLRPEVTSKLKDYNLYQQKNILTLAKIQELAVSHSISNSPLPGGLSEEEKNQYSQELESLTIEFKDQAAEFEKLIQVVNEKIIEGEAKKQAQYLPALDLALWPLPDKTIHKMILQVYKEHGLSTALFLIEKLQSNQQIESEDYNSLKAYFLINSYKNDFIRKYVKSEWEENKQTDLIKKWIRLSGVDQ